MESYIQQNGNDWSATTHHMEDSHKQMVDEKSQIREST